MPDKSTEPIVEIRQPQEGETIYGSWEIETDVPVGRKHYLASIQPGFAGETSEGIAKFLITGVEPPRVLRKAGPDRILFLTRLARQKRLGA